MYLALSRFQSLSFFVALLSYFFLPLATAISTLALGFELEFLCYGRLLTLNIAVSDLTWA